jgi:hypothetical protein
MLAWMAVLTGATGAAYSWLGFAMADSFAVAAPNHGHERAAIIYLATLTLSLAVLVLGLVYLIRHRRRPSSRP